MSEGASESNGNSAAIAEVRGDVRGMKRWEIVLTILAGLIVLLMGYGINQNAKIGDQLIGIRLQMQKIEGNQDGLSDLRGKVDKFDDRLDDLDKRVSKLDGK
jgi:preprotein translocase subunit SecG